MYKSFGKFTSKIGWKPKVGKKKKSDLNIKAAPEFRRIKACYKQINLLIAKQIINSKDIDRLISLCYKIFSSTNTISTISTKKIHEVINSLYEYKIRLEKNNLYVQQLYFQTDLKSALRKCKSKLRYIEKCIHEKILSRK